MNAHINIQKDSVLELDGSTKLLFERSLGDGLLQFTNLATGGPFQIVDDLTGASRMTDTAWIEQMIREGRLRLLRDSIGPVVGRRPSMEELDPDEIVKKDPRAPMKVFVVRELIARNSKKSDPHIGRHLREMWTPDVAERFGEMPPPSTVRRWLARSPEVDIRMIDVMSRSGCGDRATRLDPAMREFVDEGSRWYYADRGRRLRDVEAYVEDKRGTENKRRIDEGSLEPELKPVSRETIRRAILAIRCEDTLREKYGADWVKRRFRVSGDPLQTQRLLQIAMMDDKLVDAVFCIDADTRLPAGRPWLTLLVDVHTRCILGWYVSFEGPSAAGVAECIRRACRPKEIRSDRLARWPVLGSIYGLPSEIICDNGSNYVSPSTQDSFADLGIVLRLAAVRTPTMKSIVERIFFTLQTMLTSRLPGATLDIAAMRDAGYDPAKHAVLTISELHALIAEWVFVYHTTVHSGIAMQPARAWQHSMEVHGINILPDPKQLDVLIGTSERRRLTRNGVTFHGLWYRDTSGLKDLLDDLVGLEKVRDRLKSTASAWCKVRYNPANLAEIHVWNPRTKRYVTLPCVTPQYAAGLSLFQHKQIRAWAKRENLAFSTESDQLTARHGLQKLVYDLAPDIAERERRAIARMLGSAAVQRLSGSAPGIAEAASRHDGLGPVIEVAPAADEREDGEWLADRPPPTKPEDVTASPLDPNLDDQAAPGPDDDWDDDDDFDGEEAFA